MTHQLAPVQLEKLVRVERVLIVMLENIKIVQVKHHVVHVLLENTLQQGQ